MRITEKKQVIQETAIGIKCDVCGKKTLDPNDSAYYNFSSHHTDWGSDSQDSFEVHDVCSSVCYLAKLKELIADNEDYPSFEADGKTPDFLKGMLR
jgi:hypothetical protein